MVKALPPQRRLLERSLTITCTGDSALNKAFKQTCGICWGKGGNLNEVEHWVTEWGCFCGTTTTQQRVIWMWVYGEDPGEMMVDHIDQDGLKQRAGKI